MLNVKESLIIIKICKLPLKLLPRNGFATKDFIHVGIGSFFQLRKGPRRRINKDKIKRRTMSQSCNEM